MQDPTTHDAAWVHATGKPCANQLTSVPRYAYVESTGFASNGLRRYLYGTYTFRTATAGNRDGGTIRDGMPGVSHCIDGGNIPMAGTTVTMRSCATVNGVPVVGQRFSYQPNLTLALLDVAGFPDGLCLDAGWPQKVGNVVRLQPCGSATLPQQQWSFNYAASYVGTDDGLTLNDKCFARKTGSSLDSTIVLNDMDDSLGYGTYQCDERFKGPNHTWDPSPQVGAAAAGLPVTHQLVNDAKYGRCLDVTLEDPDQTWEVVFPCKQDPQPRVRDWNQQWFLPEPGTVGPVYSNTPKGPYCLTLPSLSGSSRIVDAKACTPASARANMTWRARGGDTLTYDEAFRVEGTGTWAGWCLAPVEPVWDNTADKAGIAPCSGNDLQKWNAEQVSTARFGGINEK
jgi:hypothetical protein